MAFDVTSLAPELCDVVGIVPNVAIAVGALTAGSKVFTFPGFTKIKVGIAQSHTANAARVSATAGNQVTVTGTGTDTVMVIVAGEVRR